MKRTYDYRKNVWFCKWVDDMNRTCHKDEKPTRQELDILYAKAEWNRPPYEGVCQNE